jgi:hypothetical protein
MTKITLNKAEQKLATYLAKCRYANARANGIPDKKIGPQSNWQTDLEGIGAEIAYCKAMNLYPDLEITQGYTPTEDCVTPHGDSVDVKTTKYRNGHLLATLKKAKKSCDLYALVVGSFPSYRIAGHMSHDELCRDDRIKDMGHGKGYAAPQDELEKGFLIA